MSKANSNCNCATRLEKAIERQQKLSRKFCGDDASIAGRSIAIAELKEIRDEHVNDCPHCANEVVTKHPRAVHIPGITYTVAAYGGIHIVSQGGR